MSTSHRGCPRLEPDPKVRAIILDAALEIVRDRGVHGWGIVDLLDRTHPSTRVAPAAFRLQRPVGRSDVPGSGARPGKAAATGNGRPAHRRVSFGWIRWGRWDLAFGQQVESSSRQLTLEAHAQIFTSPATRRTRLPRDSAPAHRADRSRDAFGARFPMAIRSRRQCRSTASNGRISYGPMGNRDSWPRRLCGGGFSVNACAGLGVAGTTLSLRHSRRRDYLLITTEQINRACPWLCVCGLRRAGPFAARSVGWTLSSNPVQGTGYDLNIQNRHENNQSPSPKSLSIAQY